MKLITIQNRKALNLLKNDKPFISDFNQILKKDTYSSKLDSEKYEITKIKSYQILMRHYGYINSPIFCCVVNRIANFHTVNLNKNNVIIELEVPDEYVRLMLSDKWIYLFFEVYQELWTDSLYKIYEDYLDGKGADDTNSAINAIIPYIKPEWVLGIWNIPKDFIKPHTDIRIKDFSWYDTLLWTNNFAKEVLWG